jgi:hypothetical protein
MDRNDREAIEQLFDKLRQVEGRTGPRDAEAEALIGAKVAGQPGAAYYLAQTVVMQEQALGEAQRRIEELESQPPSGGGFLGSLFGGGPRQPPRGQTYERRAAQPDAQPMMPQRGPWGGGGGGFLAGAAQTAMGVAGGVVLGNMLAGMFSGGHSAQAADRGSDTDDAGNDHDNGASGVDAHPAAQHSESDYFSGSDDGGDFGGGDGGGGGD